MTTFDFGNGNDEAAAANGDSGGALFVKVSGVWKLAGIAVDVDSNAAFYDNDLTQPGRQPDRSYFVRIRKHRAAIREIMTSAKP